MENCIFCEVDKEKIIYENDSWLAIMDEYPVSLGHALIIPKRHCESYFDLNYIELASLGLTLGVVKMILDEKYKPNGYNIGTNCGEAAGQSISHCHIHLIPRYNGDVENPKGGVRGVIPSKMSY